LAGLVVIDYVDESFAPVTSKITGWDFGLKTFLTGSSNNISRDLQRKNHAKT
jgi:hypothetical protein